MKKTTLKNLIFLCLMASFVIMSITSKNLINAKLYASIAIILGALASHSLTYNNFLKNGQDRRSEIH